MRDQSCKQILSGAFEGEADGIEAMQIQERMAAAQIRAITIRAASANAISAIFGILAFVLIMYGPADKAFASNIFSAAFLVLAAGIAGFTQLNFKAGGVNLQTSKRGTNDAVAKQPNRRRVAAAE